VVGDPPLLMRHPERLTKPLDSLLHRTRRQLLVHREHQLVIQHNAVQLAQGYLVQPRKNVPPHQGYHAAPVTLRACPIPLDARQPPPDDLTCCLHSSPSQSTSSAPPAPAAAIPPSAPAPALPADGPAGSNRSVWRRPALAGSAPGPLPSPAPAPPAHRQAGLPDCSQHAPQSAVPASRTATPDRRPHRRQCR